MPNRKQSLHEEIHRLVRDGFRPEAGKPRIDVWKDPVWQEIRRTGTRLWLDTGDLEAAGRLWAAEFDALTTNNTLLNQEVQKGIYDDLVVKSAKAITAIEPQISPKGLTLEIAFVLNAHHGLRLAEHFDAHVSVELHTALANNVDLTLEYGRRYHAICPERFYVKVPLTPAGFLATRRLADDGIPVNFTLGFSARHNYLAATLARPRFVNVFMGRLSSFVADNGLGDGVNVGEKATLSTQRELLHLRNTHKTESLLIGASMRSEEQVSALAGLDVFTMPVKVAARYHEQPDPQVRSHLDDDPSVSAAPGVALEDFNASTLWEVTDSFKHATDELLARGVEALCPDDLPGYRSAHPVPLLQQP